MPTLKPWTWPNSSFPSARGSPQINSVIITRLWIQPNLGLSFYSALPLNSKLWQKKSRLSTLVQIQRKLQPFGMIFLWIRPEWSYTLDIRQEPTWQFCFHLMKTPPMDPRGAWCSWSAFWSHQRRWTQPESGNSRADQCRMSLFSCDTMHL